MEIASAVGSGSVARAPLPDRGLGVVTGEGFMNLLIKQLQYQDPFEPMTNAEMVAQMATIRELETNTRLSTKLEQITDEQRFGAAAALMGKHVIGVVTDSEGTQYPLEGLVTGVRFTSDGKVLLELDSGEVLPLSKVERITDPSKGTTLLAE